MEVTKGVSAVSKNDLTRRQFLKGSAGVAGAVAFGIWAFSGGSQVIEAVSPGVARVTMAFPRLRIGSLDDFVEGEPLDFAFPLEEHKNFAVKLGTTANQGVGPDGDIVAFNYLCSHMGCPLNGLYNHDHKMQGPCPCHFSRFDLTKDGTLILGQATQSLPQIVLEVSGDDVEAVGVTGLVYGYHANLEGGTPVA